MRWVSVLLLCLGLAAFEQPQLMLLGHILMLAAIAVAFFGTSSIPNSKAVMELVLLSTIGLAYGVLISTIAGAYIVALGAVPLLARLVLQRGRRGP